MKKAYVTPTVEKVEFQYDKVVAESTNDPFYGRYQSTGCKGDEMTEK